VQYFGRKSSSVFTSMLGGMHYRHAVQRVMWVPAKHLL
jgi:hypothetical protein